MREKEREIFLKEHVLNIYTLSFENIAGPIKEGVKYISTPLVRDKRNQKLL